MLLKMIELNMVRRGQIKTQCMYHISFTVTAKGYGGNDIVI